MSDSELELFKTGINLSAYAAAKGYQIIRRESSRNSVSMKHSNGDKIIIARGHDQHWIYFSVSDEQDNGSIIDFVQKRQDVSLGIVRKILRQWTGTSAPYPAPKYYQTEVLFSTHDRQTVISSFARMSDALEHPYLKARAVGKEITGHDRFLGKVKRDEYGNAVFPHYDEEGLCGYEIKNKKFTGFAKGGEKGLWVSRCFRDDENIVITESAIDALSFHGLFGWDKTRYASTAGGWSEQKTVPLIKKAIQEFPGENVILAFDHDAQGKIYEAKAREVCKGIGKTIKTLYPDNDGEDWNDQLRRLHSPTLPS